MSLERRSPLRARSKKRARDDRAYTRARRVFLEQRPWCEARTVLDAAAAGHPLDGWLPSLTVVQHDRVVRASSACAGRASEVHHVAGRDGHRLLDESSWLAICGPCHRFVTTEPELARLLGLARRRHQVDGGRAALAVLIAVTVLSAFVFFALILTGGAP